MTVPEIGQALPTITYACRSHDLVAYAGATWDWHPLHHDQRRCEELGLPAPIVDGQMFGALFARQVIAAFGPQARVVGMRFRFASLVHAGETVEVHGTITEVRRRDDHLAVVVDQQVRCGDRLAIREAATRVTVP